MLIYGIKYVKMKNKILNLSKSAVWFVLCLLVGALIFEGVRSLANSNEPAKEFSTTVFIKRKDTIILLWTQNTEFMLFTQRVVLALKINSV